MLKVVSGRASGIKRAKLVMPDQLTVSTPDKGRGQKKTAGFYHLEAFVSDKVF